MKLHKGEKMSEWNEILKQYEILGVESVIPIAHIRIRPDVRVLVDAYGNFIGATATKNERCSIPCTINSESRTSGIAPHPIHDNMSYVCGDYPQYKKRHAAYMDQLREYIESVDDPVAKSVYQYLSKRTIRYDIKPVSEKLDTSEEKLMIIFSTLTKEETHMLFNSRYREKVVYAGLTDRGTISTLWRDYYISTLEKNGVCGITGEPDYIPDKYPKGIRNPADQTKLFIATPKKMDWMPTITPGYITSQKIIHTLQFMIYEGDSWAYQILKNQDNLPKEYKKWVKEYERKKA